MRRRLVIDALVHIGSSRFYEIAVVPEKFARRNERDDDVHFDHRHFRCASENPPFPFDGHACVSKRVTCIRGRH
jgi:hypothetical protein